MKTKLLLLSLLLVGLTSCNDTKEFLPEDDPMTRSELTNDEVEKHEYSIKEPYEFPVKPGTPQWSGLTSWHEMYELSQISEDVLTDITTEALAETCLSYSLAFDFLYANDELLRISQTIADFNGLNELCKREDGAKCLVDEYEKLDKFAINRPPHYLIKESYSILAYAELLLSNDAFFTKLNEEDLRHLYEITSTKLEYKLNNIDYFSYVDLKKSLLLNSKIRLKVDNSISESEKECLINFIRDYNNITVDELEIVSRVANFMK